MPVSNVKPYFPGFGEPRRREARSRLSSEPRSADRLPQRPKDPGTEMKKFETLAGNLIYYFLIVIGGREGQR